jgi:hypothetical protein
MQIAVPWLGLLKRSRVLLDQQEGWETLDARPLFPSVSCVASSRSTDVLQPMAPRVVTGCIVVRGPCMPMHSECDHSDVGLVTKTIIGEVIIVEPSGPILCPITSLSRVLLEKRFANYKSLHYALRCKQGPASGLDSACDRPCQTRIITAFPWDRFEVRRNTACQDDVWSIAMHGLYSTHIPIQVL